MKQRLADYVFGFLAERGVSHVFMVTGGGAMFLNDAIGKTSGMQYVCCHHEQACAMAAEGYSRINGKPGVVNVTTGPGTINALTGIFGAYTDSIPMVIISGQNKRETILPTYNLPGLRQLGEQEADIIPMVKGITKYAVLVNDPATIRYHLERAWYLSTAGRPGPVWLDLPVDVSSMQIDPEELKGYDPKEDAITYDSAKITAAAKETIDRIRAAKRPVIMAGTGVRLANAIPEFEAVCKLLQIPVTTAWTAHDLLASDDPLNCGRPSSIGNRAGNFTVQNSDVLLVLGSRLNIRQVSYNWKDFARHAFKIHVDVDPAELSKPTVKSDLTIEVDLKVFLNEILAQLQTGYVASAQHAEWLAWCRKRVERYSRLTDEMLKPKERINPYVFVDALMKKLGKDDVVVCGNGSACVMPFQVGYIAKGLRMFCNSGSATMGFDLPAAVGAACAKKGRIICLAGDGSIMFNLQELQTIVHHRLPVKVIVLNNEGYLSMRMTQKNFFKGNLVGEGPRSGVTFPNFSKVGTAFEIPSIRIEKLDFGAELDAFLATEGYGLAEIILDPDQVFEPKLAARQLPSGKIVSPSLEDMWPFLSREELESNMLVPLVEQAP